MTSLYIEFSIYLRCLAYLLVKRYNHRNLIILVLILLLIIIQLNSGYILKTDKHKIVLLFLISGAKLRTILIHCSPKLQKFYFFLSNFQKLIQIESATCKFAASCQNDTIGV